VAAKHAGLGSDDFVMLTLGTGIGCSVLIRGRALRGKHFQAGVLGGHLIANPLDGPPCAACPSSGCYEAESATQSLTREANKHPDFPQSSLAAVESLDFAAVFGHASNGDAVAVAVRGRCLRYWTALAVSLVHAFDPDRIVIGGGVADNPLARAFFPAMQDGVNRQAWIVEPIEIRAASLGNQAGIIGAGSLFTHQTPYI